MRTQGRRGKPADEWTALMPSAADDGIFFGQKLRGENGGGQIVAHISDLIGCSATDLRRTLRHMRETVSGYSTLLVSEVPLDYFDEEQSSVSPIAFSLHEGELVLEITFLVDTWDDDEEQARFVSSVLQPFLGHHRMRVLEVWQDEHYVEPPWPWHARIALTTRSRSLDDIYSVGKQAIALLHAVGPGGLDREAVVHLVRAGHPEVLVGQREGPWLDVKEQHYDHVTQAGQISTCQAISRFCNAEGGGIIVVGMSTKKLPDGEQIRAIRPVPIGAHTVRRYRQAIERCLFPPPDNLSVESVFLGKEKGLIVIDVPPQPEELKPFLVHGSIVDGKVQGTFISILRRRDDTSIPITAPMIHSTLAAGRALLRRGELPNKLEPLSGPDTGTP